jgi:hypothetical protein
MSFEWPSRLGRADEGEVTQVFAPRKAGREGIPEGPVRPTRRPTHAWPNGQVKCVFGINAPHGIA